MRILDRQECISLLRRVPVGRIVFTEQALPAIRPVNFLLHEDTVVIRCGEGGKLAVAAEGAIVAFEVDEFDATGHIGWSVVVIGQAEIVTDPDAIAALADLPLDPWAPGRRCQYIRIPLARLTGRRIEKTR